MKRSIAVLAVAASAAFALHHTTPPEY